MAARRTQLITAFVPNGPDAGERVGSGGNPCRLVILENAMAEVVCSDSEFTLCQSWPAVHNNQTVIAVVCFTAGGDLIRCCGHGLLAAAYSWQRQLQCDQLSLQMHGSLVPSWREQDFTWLRFKRLRTSNCPVPDWAAALFPDSPQPIAAAECGDDQGYLVLQWPDEFSLDQLPLPGPGLAQQSQRALICTAAQPSAGAGAVQLRYFAPQYGVAEDAATGSAARVLADYWSNCGDQLTARQCSPAGGMLLTRLTPDHVEVGGRCIIWE